MERRYGGCLAALRRPFFFMRCLFDIVHPPPHMSDCGLKQHDLILVLRAHVIKTTLCGFPQTLNRLQRKPNVPFNFVEAHHDARLETFNSILKALDTVVEIFDAVAKGSDAVVNGSDAVANGSDAVANGSDAVVNGSDAVVNGSDAVVNGSDAVANGSDAVANGSDAALNSFDAASDSLNLYPEALDAAVDTFDADFDPFNARFDPFNACSEALHVSNELTPRQHVVCHHRIPHDDDVIVTRLDAIGMSLLKVGHLPIADSAISPHGEPSLA
jgi:hypothetical protein